MTGLVVMGGNLGTRHPLAVCLGRSERACIGRDSPSDHGWSRPDLSALLVLSMSTPHWRNLRDFA